MSAANLAMVPQAATCNWSTIGGQKKTDSSAGAWHRSNNHRSTRSKHAHLAMLGAK
jgi:hypothetical protein